MGFSIDDLAQLQFDAQVSIDERRNKYGRIGIPSTSGYSIPVSEQGKRLISVTLEDGTIIKADAARVSPVASARVRVRRESGIWVIKGADEREVLSGSPSSGTVSIPKHQHNIGAPPGLFYPVDPASVNDGMLLPTGSGLQVTVGRVTYPKSDGSIGIYDANGMLDFASAVSGLSANQARWAIAYIDKSDGSVDFHSPATATAPMNTTTDLEDAIADCLDNVANAYPYHAVRIRAGVSTFGTYKMMAGRSMDEKDFIRLGWLSGNSVKSNFSATAAPTVDNDIDEGYVVSSRWFDVTNEKEYVCLDNSDGAAVWIETTQSTSSAVPNYPAASDTISSGVLAVGANRFITVQAETGTTDDLVEITGLSQGDSIMLIADSGDTITVKHNSGSATIKILIQDDADFVLDEVHPLHLVLKSSTELVQVYDETGASAGGNNRVEISTTTLGSSQSSVSFTSIPSSYEKLVIEMIVETDRAAATQDTINIAFNSDATDANYVRSASVWNNSARADSDGADRLCGLASAANSSAGAFAYNILEIINYADTTFWKKTTCQVDRCESITDNQNGQYSVTWKNTSAITRIDLTPVNGTNFVTGSKFTLYGIVSS